MPFPAEPMDDQLLQETYEARERYLKQMGELDDPLLAPIVNPTELGGPRWPALRQSWRVVRNGRRTIIVSDGLSDPFDDADEPNTGLGIEILAEAEGLEDDSPQKSWLFALVYKVSQQAARIGRFRELIDEMGVLSMEIKSPSADFYDVRTEAGHVGLLLGLAPPELDLDWELPAGRVQVITAKVLLPDELAYVAEEYETAREVLRERFAADGTYHRSSLDRAPVI